MKQRRSKGLCNRRRQGPLSLYRTAGVAGVCQLDVHAVILEARGTTSSGDDKGGDGGALKTRVGRQKTTRPKADSCRLVAGAQRFHCPLVADTHGVRADGPGSCQKAEDSHPLRFFEDHLDQLLDRQRLELRYIVHDAPLVQLMNWSEAT